MDRPLPFMCIANQHDRRCLNSRTCELRSCKVGAQNGMLDKFEFVNASVVIYYTTSTKRLSEREYPVLRNSPESLYDRTK